MITSKKTANRLSSSRAASGHRVATEPPWHLKLYVAGQTPKSLTALSNLKHFCEEHLKDRYSIEVVDLAKDPGLARTDQIIAVPTLVRKLPQPVRKIIGDLSSREKVLTGLDLLPAQ